MSLWAQVRHLYEADLEQRLQQCRDDLDQLDRMLERIGDRMMLSSELAGDQEQIARIYILVDAIGQQVLDLQLSREILRLSLTEQAS